MPSIDPPNSPEIVTAQRVPESARLEVLPRYFGTQMMNVEQRIYHFMREFVSEYKGAYWHFYELSNGGFYMAPERLPVRFRVHSNNFDAQMSADAAGITVCLFALSHMSFQWPDEESLSLHFYRLRAFAMEHAEAGLIFAAID